MKCGLRQSALAQVKVAFAGEKSLTENLFRALEGAALGKILLVGDQYIANEVGMIEEIDSLIPDLEQNDVAVFRG
jgi:hypothetical protein